MKNPSDGEPLELSGVWCVPDDPEYLVAGILRYSPDKPAELDLVGSLRKAPAAQPGVPVSFDLFDHAPPLIWGMASEGGLITLLNPVQSAGTMSLHAASGMLHSDIRSVIRSKYLCTTVFIGHHFRAVDEVQFPELSTRFTHLDEWSEQKGFEFQQRPDGSISMDYVLPPPQPLYGSDDCEIMVKWRVPGFPLLKASREIELKQEAWIVVKFGVAQGMQACVHIVSKLETFLRFGVMADVRPSSIIGSILTDRGRVNVEILLTLRDYDPHENKASVKMLFTLTDVSKSQRPLFAAWLAMSEQFQTLYGLYFGTLRNSKLYINLQYLGFIHALETYVRTMLPSPSNVEHDANVDRIIGTSPADLVEWITDKLSYRSEMSFRDKLRWILAQHQSIAAEIVGNQDAFLRLAVKTRNYYTHFDKADQFKAAVGSEFVELVRKVRLLTELCLLAELGFEPEQMKESLIRSGRLTSRLSAPVQNVP